MLHQYEKSNTDNLSVPIAVLFSIIDEVCQNTNSLNKSISHQS